MKYVIIGGVAGGATAAARLRRVDEQAEIILLEKGAVEKDKYGFLERENGVWYFKLNVKIGLVKR